jgi:O-antigen/teichoic acid export membrane protein
LATSRVVQSGTTATTNLGMGLGGFGSSGLILGGVFGQGIATTVLVRMILQKDRYRLKKINKLKIFALSRRYKKLPIFNLPNAFIDGFRLLGINILIATFYTTSILGQFSLAWKMIQMPMGLIGASLSQVFFQKVATTNKNNLSLLVRKFMFRAFLVAFPIFFIIYIYARDIFTIVFGENWEVAGEVASILTPWLFLNFLTSPLANLFVVFNKQEVVLGVSFLYMILPLMIIWIFNEYGFLYVLSLITYVMSFILISYIVLVFLYIKKEKKDGI